MTFDSWTGTVDGGKWRLPENDELDRLVCEHVLGWKWYRFDPSPGVQSWGGDRLVLAEECPRGYRSVETPTGLLPDDWNRQLIRPSVYVLPMWRIVETMNLRMGYERPGYRWNGPCFKPEDKYLKQHGLGQTCWYVAVESSGLRWVVEAKTPNLAVCWAALEVLAVERTEVNRVLV
jgi:hypothetical protein